MSQAKLITEISSYIIRFDDIKMKKWAEIPIHNYSAKILESMAIYSASFLNFMKIKMGENIENC